MAVKRNHTGHRVGQDHHRAKMDDATVRQLRALYASKAGGYRVLARRFGCGQSTVRDIVTMRTRWAS